MHIATLAILCFLSATPSETLTGKVVDEQNAPIPNASVGIYTVIPKPDMPVVNHFYYDDFSRQVRSNPLGEFTINRLDPRLQYRILMLAPGCKSAASEPMDPSVKQLSIQLQKQPQDLPSDQVLKGRVLSADGKPIANATVLPFGAKTSDTHWFGPIKGTDIAAVTDADGNFTITSETSKVGMYLRVSAADHASINTPLLELDGKVHEIRLREGSHVAGRLLFEGKPIPERLVGIVQLDRSTNGFVGARVNLTDVEGRFRFAHLQPNQKYLVFSLLDSTQNLPFLQSHFVTTSSEGQLLDEGDLSLKEAVTFSGKIALPNGDAIPPMATLRLSRDPAWDYNTIPLSKEGEFSFQGLPQEAYRIHVSVPGYEIDTSNLPHQSTGDNEFAVSLRKREGVVQTSIPLKKKP